MNLPPKVAASTEIGLLEVCHLKRLWSATLAARQGATIERNEQHLDQLVLNALGLGLHQTVRHLLMTTPAFTEFEEWIVAIAGRPDRMRVDRINADIAGEPPPESVSQWLDTIDASDAALTCDELSFWEENGFIILQDAVSETARTAAESAIWDHLGANPAAPESWYGVTDHGIMIELIQHPALEANRRSARIHKAFAQLWQTTDLWVTADRCGFHPPQRIGYPFPGPDLHWDIDFDKPLIFGTQGILYLTDTPPEQGALTVVPGFHKKLSDWLADLEPEADPQQQDLHALGSQPIGAKAGDMVIWHQSLPHGSRPNLGDRPRIVQYINMLPGAAYQR